MNMQQGGSGRRGGGRGRRGNYRGGYNQNYSGGRNSNRDGGSGGGYSGGRGRGGGGGGGGSAPHVATTTGRPAVQLCRFFMTGNCTTPNCGYDIAHNSRCTLQMSVFAH